MGFVANLIRFLAMQKCKNRLRFDKVIESIKVGTFLRHSVLFYFTHTYSFIFSASVGYFHPSAI